LPAVHPVDPVSVMTDVFLSLVSVACRKAALTIYFKPLRWGAAIGSADSCAEAP